MMVATTHHLHLLLLPFLTSVVNVVYSNVNPFSCSDQIQTCNSYLYHISSGFSVQQVASLYSVNTSNIKPITRGLKQDHLVSVPCTCRDVNGTQGYFYDTHYRVGFDNTFENLTATIYGGQAWNAEGEDQEPLFAGEMISLHLVCGCSEMVSEEMITYTVQENDTLSEIAKILSANLSRIETLNKNLIQDPNYILVGWVLFIPMEKNGIHQGPKKGKVPYSTLAIILTILSAAMLFSTGALLLFLLKRDRSCKGHREEDAQVIVNDSSPFRRTCLRSVFHDKDIKDATCESQRPVLYSLEEIDAATDNFNESRKIGEGGYGTVYIGILHEREVAIKKMKSSRSKEFLSELKVLCKIHHINVVELLGYARGDNFLYLVYEYIQNGSLNNHLHDPLLKGHSPLSWTARASIALDAARGIEYIHDHTKARCVHRDIKTSNILLDQELRAKVSDFGLARLVERSNEEDAVATCLVGTPGYIAPESVRDLQMTSKTDVYAFGVVLAELITGQRALARDSQQPNKMKSLVSVMLKIFKDQDSETALEANIDSNLKGIYAIEEAHRMAEISMMCLDEDPTNRPEMGEIVQALSHILMSSIEWEASLGGSSQGFSGLVQGR